MDEKVLIQQCRIVLDQAEIAFNGGDLDDYASLMSSLLDYLMKELVGEAPEPCESSESSES